MWDASKYKAHHSTKRYTLKIIILNLKKQMKRRRLGDGVVWGWARGQK